MSADMFFKGGTAVKGACFLLALCCLLTLTGCGGQPEASDPVSRPDVPQTDTQQGLTTFALAYSYEDTLDPFATKSEANFWLAGLLYDALVEIEDGFVPTLSLAAAVDTPDPTHLTVSLRSAAFSDGSPVTPGDVVASFRRAKESVHYRALLANVTSAAVSGDGVAFTLAAADVNGLAALSFPVVKDGTFTAEAGKAPVGSGPYVYEPTASGARLTARGAATYPTVMLRHLPNSMAMYYALASGDIAYHYSDLDTGELPQRIGANAAVDMNGLVFLGVNSARPRLGDATVRRALSALLDRGAIATAAYSGWATPSQQPFHPTWQPMTALSLASPLRVLDGAVRLLDEAGCSVGSEGKRLTLELLYCTDNSDRAAVAELARTQMLGGGVEITTVGLAEEEYLARLQKGEYDLYLGEIRLTADMSLRPLLMGGAASYGVPVGGAAAVAYSGYLRGDTDLAAFLQTFAADLPYIPLCWRSGFAAYDRQLTVVTPTGYNPYNGLAGWQ